MKKRRRILTKSVFGLLLLAAGGCYTYPKPPAAFMESSYTVRKADKADDLLKGIKQLSLADAQRISIINNPSYIAAYHAVSAAQMRYYQAIGAYSPVVSASFGLSQPNNWNRKNVNGSSSSAVRTEGFQTSTSLQATWLLFDGFARTLKVLAEKHSYSYEALLEENTCRTLMYSVARAYNEVLLAIENIRISKENRIYQEALLRYTRLKYQAGAVPLSEVLNFEILMNSAEGDLVSAEYQYETAVYALAVLMGYPEGTLPPEIEYPTDYKNKYTDLPSVDSYLDQALSNRPDLKGYREQLEIAKYQMYQTYSSYSPTVNANFAMGYGTNLTRYYGNAPQYGHTYSESPSVSYGLTADWTIFNGLIRYNTMREYQARVAIADFNVANQWLEVVREVRTAYANYIQSVKLTRIYEQNRNLSSEQRDLVDEGYKAGNIELTRLNEVQRDLVQAETNLASSYINIQNAKAQLDAAVSAYSAGFYRGEGGKGENSGLLPDNEVPANVSPADAAPGITNTPAAVPAAAPAIPATPTAAP